MNLLPFFLLGSFLGVLFSTDADDAEAAYLLSLGRAAAFYPSQDELHLREALDAYFQTRPDLCDCARVDAELAMEVSAFELLDDLPH